MSNTNLALIVLILVAVNAVALYLINRSNKRKDEGGDKSLSLLLETFDRQMNDMSEKLVKMNTSVEDKISRSNKDMNETVQSQFRDSAKLIRDVTEGLTKLDETNKQVVSFADQLQSLESILKNPKQRGILGEYYLETLLKNVLPPGSFKMQYAFSDGEIVDAVVFVRDKVIPIDSKFSLENYNRLIGERDPLERERLEKVFKNDLKLRIDETAKYVRPSEGTMEFAFMFIPHEAIYYDLLISQVGTAKINTRDLIEYAFRDKKVIIVSPTSFLAYLQTVLQGLKALQIEESAKEIRKGVENLSRHMGAYEQFLGSLGTSLTTSVNHYNKAYKELHKIDKDIIKITGTAIGIDPKIVDKPDMLL